LKSLKRNYFKAEYENQYVYLCILQISARGVPEEAEKLGYDGAEIWGGRPHAYFEDMTSSRIGDIRSTLDGLGLAISGFIPAQFRYPVNIASTDRYIREKSVDYIKRNIDAAAALGSPLVSVCPGYGTYGEPLKNAETAMIKSLKKILAHARGSSLKILIEPAHPMETDLVVTVSDAINLIESEGLAGLGLCIDVGHAFINKENLTEITRYGGRYPVHYHIDDNFGAGDDHLVPGEGKIPLREFLASVKESGYQGFLTAELGFNYTTDPDSASRRTINYLKGI